jgi:anti-anti-sigma factor
MSLKVKTKEKQAGVFVISCIGSLNTNTYSSLETRLNLIFEGHPKLIVFDMENLDYISSMGVRVILQTQKKMKSLNGSSKMMNLKPQVEKVFEIINALPSDQVFSTEKEMDEYLDKIQKKVARD